MSKKQTIQLLTIRIITALMGIVVVGSSVVVYLPMERVSANGEEFAVYVGETPAQKKTIADNWNDNNDSYNASGWGQMRVFARGGLFNAAGEKGATLRFNATDTKEVACDGGCESREPIFTITYYCGYKDQKVRFDRPADSEDYYRVQYAVALHDNGDSGDEFVKKENFNGFSGVLRVHKHQSNSEGYGREELSYDMTEGQRRPHDLPDGDKENKNGNDGAFGIEDKHKTCRPSGSGADELSNIRNWARLSSAEKAKFQDPNSAEGKGGTTGGSGNAENSDEQPNCETSASNPASWFLCALIDGLAGVSDFIFGTFIEPFLENVPISTNPDDPGYKTWQGFRVLGNIVLIGALLAIVYYQARGGR